MGNPVMLGFVNGLAIVIFLAQLGQFKVPDGMGGQQWMEGQALYIMLGLVALTMAIIHFLPKLTTAVPSSLAAIVTVTAIVIGFDFGWLGEQRPTPPENKNRTGIAPEKKTTLGVAWVGLLGMYRQAT